MKKIVRVFPSRTRATPDDELAFCSEPDFWIEADEVHISVTFSWDLIEAERLATEWSHVGKVVLGGPAIGTRGDEFVPGMYLKHGYVITSRGCPNKCWFCSVWKRDGNVRELPITNGWILNDDNLLACSENHIRNVFDMLGRQPKRPELVGGLEAARLQRWHVDLIKKCRPSQIWFAYDTTDDYEPLLHAGKLLTEAELTSISRAYVLIGYPKDTFDKAKERLLQSYEAGFLPFAMLYRGPNGTAPSIDWKRFQRLWARPAATRSICKQSAKNPAAVSSLPGRGVGSGYLAALRS